MILQIHDSIKTIILSFLVNRFEHIINVMSGQHLHLQMLFFKDRSIFLNYNSLTEKKFPPKNKQQKTEM